MSRHACGTVKVRDSNMAVAAGFFRTSLSSFLRHESKVFLQIFVPILVYNYHLTLGPFNGVFLKKFDGAFIFLCEMPVNS